MIDTLVLGDLHHGKDDEFMLAYQVSFLKGAKAYIVAKSIKRLIITGDLHDKRKIADVRIVNIFKQLYDEISELVEEIIIVRGNHDSYYNTSGEYHSIMMFFSNLKGNVKIVDKEPMVREQGDKKIVFCPWIDDSNKEVCLKVIEENNKPENIIFGHFELAGFDITSSYQSTSGQLEKYMYNKYALVMSGHYHLMQKKENVLYIGSPYQMTFGEFGQHGIFVMEGFDVSTLQFVQNNQCLFVKMIIPSFLSADEIAEKVKPLAGKICDVFIDSNDGIYIASVEEQIEKMKPQRINIRVKDAEIVEEGEQRKFTCERDIVREYSNAISVDSKEEEAFMQREFVKIYEETSI